MGMPREQEDFRAELASTMSRLMRPDLTGEQKDMLLDWYNEGLEKGKIPGGGREILTPTQKTAVDRLDNMLSGLEARANANTLPGVGGVNLDTTRRSK